MTLLPLWVSEGSQMSEVMSETTIALLSTLNGTSSTEPHSYSFPCAKHQGTADAKMEQSLAKSVPQTLLRVNGEAQAACQEPQGPLGSQKSDKSKLKET